MDLCRYHSVLKQQTLRVAIGEGKAEQGYQLRGVKGGEGGMNIAELKQAIIKGIYKAIKNNERVHLEVQLNGLLKCLAKLAEGDDDFQDILKLLPKFKEILLHGNKSEQRSTIACLKELSRSMEASQQFINDETLNKMLEQLTTSPDKDISDNAHSILWRSGKSIGILPSKTDMVLSEEFPKNFTINESLLGRGAFGSVHLVTDETRPEDKNFVAKKSCFAPFTETNSFLGTLAAFISKRGSLGENLTRHFTIQIVEGVNYLHQNNILHRDIKGNNVLMEDDWNLKITDFGLSEFIDANGVSTEIATVRYMAPEVIYTEGNVIQNYTSRADIWSVGCTAVEMVTGKPPYPSLLSAQIIFHTALGNPLQYHLPETSSVYFREFLNRILHRDSKSRPTAEWLLKNDPFILGRDALESLDDIK
ncbi:uncharacterized protein LOC131935284 [Physella acuta]|uniref:uncharacterized protein LOC131935284 n=1 Tax=Physella acuta TaxID=109671 RepID=UPI0027DE7A4A|nr:uncharacterized protein LOC131935284 [Physella acuta]